MFKIARNLWNSSLVLNCCLLYRAEKLLIAINKSYEGAVDLTSDDKDPDAEVLSESSDEDVIISGSYIDEEELEEIKVANDCM